MENIIIPEPRSHKSRLTAAAKALEPKQSVLCADANISRCVRAYGLHRGWVMVQKKEGRKIRVWRLS